MIRSTRRSLILSLIVTTAILGTMAPAAAQEVVPYKLADGLAVYIGVIPAEIIKGHVAGHAEAEMHEGAPSARHAHHILAAVFDAASGQRVVDAAVTASVAGLGLAGTVKTLEPMTIADSITYGNYFNLPGRDRYRIRIDIRRPDQPDPVGVEFIYDHRD